MKVKNSKIFVPIVKVLTAIFVLFSRPGLRRAHDCCTSLFTFTPNSFHVLWRVRSTFKLSHLGNVDNWLTAHFLFLGVTTTQKGTAVL